MGGACQGGCVKALVCDVSVPRQVVTALLGRIDKRFFFGPFSPAVLKEIPDPVLPADDWVVITTRLCGICGSDYKQMFLNGSMDNPDDGDHLVPAGARARGRGHDRPGRARGAHAAHRRARRAESVALVRSARHHPALPRMRRPASTRSAGTSRAGSTPARHPHRQFSSKATGGLRRSSRRTNRCAFPIPDGVSDEHAVLADPFSVSLHGILKRPPQPGRPGSSTAAARSVCSPSRSFARSIPTTRIFASRASPHQRRLAEQFGAARRPAPRAGGSPRRAHRRGDGRAGAAAVVRAAVALRRRHRRHLRHGGIPGDGRGRRPPGRLARRHRRHGRRGTASASNGRRSTSRRSRSSAPTRSASRSSRDERAHAMELYLDLVRTGRIDVTPILTHRFTLDQYRDAFLACGEQDRPGAVKVLFTYPTTMDERRGKSPIDVVRRLRAAGFETYLAGGCVRDRLLGREPGDLRRRHRGAARDGPHALRPHRAGRRAVRRHPRRSKAARSSRSRPSAPTTPTSTAGARAAVHFATAAEDAQRRDFTDQCALPRPDRGSR